MIAKSITCPSKFDPKWIVSFHVVSQVFLLIHWNIYLMSRYIGGCCGFEPYHIRAVSEELSGERGGKVSDGSQKHDVWGGGLRMHTKPWVRARARKDYWSNLNPACGRPYRYIASKVVINTH